MCAVKSPRAFVSDMHGEIYLHERGWFGRWRWERVYAALSCRRRHLFLFSSQSALDRHLPSRTHSSSPNEPKEWKACIRLRGSSLFVYPDAYFNRHATFELCCPDRIYHVSCNDENERMRWMVQLSKAGVMLKSDVKHILMWRPMDERSMQPASYFCFTHASSSLPPRMPRAQREWSGSGWIDTSSSVPSPSPLTASVIPPVVTPRPTRLILGTEYTPDASFGRHGYLLKWSNSTWKRRSQSKQSIPAVVTNNVEEMTVNEHGVSPYQQPIPMTPHDKHWRLRFCRTAQLDVGRHCLLLYKHHAAITHPTASKHRIQLKHAQVFDLHQLKYGMQQQGVMVRDEQLPSLPPTLPSPTPGDELDIALHVTTPSPKWHFFRAYNAQQKQQWIAVLRNLTGQQQYETPRAQPTLVKARVGGLGYEGSIDKDSARNGISPSVTLRADQDANHDCNDESNVHVMHRDLYAWVGVSAEPSSVELLQRYDAIRADLMQQLELARSMAEKEKEPSHETGIGALPNGRHVEPKPSLPDSLPDEHTHANGRASQLFIDTSTPSHHTLARDQGVATSSTSAMPASSSTSSVPPAPFPSSLLSFLRVKHELATLHCVFNILLDPVRRLQYDQRRRLLHIGHLTQHNAAEEEYMRIRILHDMGLDDDDEKHELVAQPTLSHPDIIHQSNTAASDIGSNTSSHVLSLPSQDARLDAALPPREDDEPPVRKPPSRQSSTSALELIPEEEQETERKYSSESERKEQQKEDTEVEEKEGVLLHEPSVSSQSLSTHAAASPPLLSDIVASPLMIFFPIAHTQWMVGDEVDIVWNKMLDRNGSINGAACEQRAIRLQLMRERTILRPVEVYRIPADVPNIGIFTFSIPLDLPPSNRYFIQLTLLPGQDSSIRPQSITSRSPVFTILPLTKAERYDELETEAEKQMMSRRRNSNGDGKQSNGRTNTNGVQVKGAHQNGASVKQEHSASAQTNGESSVSSPIVRLHLPSR